MLVHVVRGHASTAVRPTAQPNRDDGGGNTSISAGLGSQIGPQQQHAQSVSIARGDRNIASLSFFPLPRQNNLSDAKSNSGGRNAPAKPKGANASSGMKCQRQCCATPERPALDKEGRQPTTTSISTPGLLPLSFSKPVLEAAISARSVP